MKVKKIVRCVGLVRGWTRWLVLLTTGQYAELTLAEISADARGER